jgi:hypothetical protein
MLKTAQKDLDAAKKADKNSLPGNPLKAVFNQLEVDKKRKDQAAANVLQAKEKLAACEKAALDASRQYVLTEIEKERLLLIHGHLHPPPSPTQQVDLPVPNNLDEEQKAKWLEVVARANAKAAAEAKAELAQFFPEAMETTESTEEGERGVPVQGSAKKGKFGERGVPLPTAVQPNEAASASARAEKDARTKKLELDGDFKRALEGDNAAAFEGVSPLDGNDADVECDPVLSSVSAEEVEARAAKEMSAALDRASKEREAKQKADADLAAGLNQQKA